LGGEEEGVRDQDGCVEYASVDVTDANGSCGVTRVCGVFASAAIPAGGFENSTGEYQR